MANVMNVLFDFIPPRAFPVKGSAELMEVGDLVFLDGTFQGNTAQDTLRPSSAGSATQGTTTAKNMFANQFAGVARQRHDLNSFDTTRLVSVDAEVEYIMVNSTGTDTAATADIIAGTRVAVGVASGGALIDDRVQVDGHSSASVAANEAIGFTSRTIKNGDRTVKVHIRGIHVMDRT